MLTSHKDDADEEEVEYESSHNADEAINLDALYYETEIDEDDDRLPLFFRETPNVTEEGKMFMLTGDAREENFTSDHMEDHSPQSPNYTTTSANRDFMNDYSPVSPDYRSPQSDDQFPATLVGNTYMEERISFDRSVNDVVHYYAYVGLPFPVYFIMDECSRYMIYMIDYQDSSYDKSVKFVVDYFLEQHPRIISVSDEDPHYYINESDDR